MPNQVVLIGDTPNDAAAAHAAGARIIGVGTGKHTPGDLKAAGADPVWSSLPPPGEVLDVVLSVTCV